MGKVDALLDRALEIMRKSLGGFDYAQFELRRKYLEHAFEKFKAKSLEGFELRFLAEEVKESEAYVSKIACNNRILCPSG